MKQTGQERYQPGRLAYSLQGRDTGRVYVIIQRENQYCFVADGEKRPLADPKRKNIRHLQLISRFVDLAQADDAIIIQAIQDYQKRLQNQEDSPCRRKKYLK